MRVSRRERGKWAKSCCVIKQAKVYTNSFNPQLDDLKRQSEPKNISIWINFSVIFFIWIFPLINSPLFFVFLLNSPIFWPLSGLIEIKLFLYFFFYSHLGFISSSVHLSLAQRLWWTLSQAAFMSIDSLKALLSFFAFLHLFCGLVEPNWFLFLYTKGGI